MNRYLILDYETRSEANLKFMGSFEYAKHPTTKILCVAWKYGTKEELKTALVRSWSPAFDYGLPDEMWLALVNPQVVKVAHNAMFEQVITRFVLPRYTPLPQLDNIPHSEWLCTASLGAALALPRKLEGACEALNLPVKKDKEGHRLMLKLSKPRTISIYNKKKWHNKLSDLKRVIQYCETDVEATTGLFLRLPALNPIERKVWKLDQKINFRGFYVDRPFVNRTLSLIKEETEALHHETKILTRHFVSSTAQRAVSLRWIESEGLKLPDLTAKTVQDALQSGIATGKVKRFLEIRKAVSKSSTAKYAAFESRSRSDGRLRDILVYHAASTGRWGGAGVQPQNFPRGTLKSSVLQATDLIQSCDLETLRLLYGDPMSVFSSCIRSGIIAPPGKELHWGDYASIELRVLFWVAHHEAGLKSIRDDTDLYAELATHIYRKKIEHVGKGTDDREVGKRGILGAGFGMGSRKFKQTCADFGQTITDEVAKNAITAYRTLHAPVVYLWSNLERAAISAVLKKGAKFKINRTAWFVEGDFLFCELPSGRRLAYANPEIRQTETPWGEMKPTLYHFGVDPYSKKWVIAGTYGGRLTENVVQGTARDILAEAKLRLEENGYEVVLSVHDEPVTERAIGEGSLEEFNRLQAESPTWAEGLPIQVENWCGPVYVKKA